MSLWSRSVSPWIKAVVEGKGRTGRLELSVVDQRYNAVMRMIPDGRKVTELDRLSTVLVWL